MKPTRRRHRCGMSRAAATRLAAAICAHPRYYAHPLDCGHGTHRVRVYDRATGCRCELAGARQWGGPR